MKSISCVFVLIMILALSVFSQGYKSYNYGDISNSILNFSGTSARYTSTMPTGDYEGIEVLVRVPKSVTAKFVLSYQRGKKVGNFFFWDQPVMIDTFNTTEAANYKTIDSMVTNTGNDTDVVKAIDSTQLSGYTTMYKQPIVYRSPFGRFRIKGLTGNSGTGYTVLINTTLLKYYNNNDFYNGKRVDQTDIQ